MLCDCSGNPHCSDPDLFLDSNQKFKSFKTEILVLFSAMFKLWMQNLPLKWVRFFHPMFANCVHANVGSLFTSEREFFSPNCSKFAVEYDWINKTFQNVQKLGLFWKNGWIFFEKNLTFFKTVHCGKFF